MLDKFIDFIFQYRPVVIFLTLLIIVPGVFAWQKLDIDAFPDVTNIQVMILTEAPGLAAVDVEQQITYPIESQMGGLPYVRQVRSLSKSGLSQVIIIFEDFVDTYFTRQIVNERLQLAKEILPEGVEPELGPVSTGLGEIYQYTLKSSTKDLMELRTIQDWLIAPQLRIIPGVTEVNSFGGFVKQYHIEVAPEKLTKYGLTLRDIYEAVQKNNANAPGNYIVKGWEQSYIRSIGLVGTIPDIENIVLAAEDGTPVYLKDVAEIRLGPETRQGAVSRDGKGETVAGMVIMLKGANSKEVVDRVKAKIPQIQANLAKEGVQIDAFYDRTSLIQTCVKTVTNALLEGMFLVIMVIFIFLWNFRAGLIVALALPLSALITFILMQWQGISANLMSLGGLSIAIGMIADGTIVVTENIIRHHTEKKYTNHSIIQIVSIATKEVAQPVLFGILIIIVVFLPLFTLEQTEGKMFRPLATTICLAMGASLMVGLIIIPVICSLFFRNIKESHDSFLMRGIKKLYQPLLATAIQYKTMVISLAVLFLIISISLLSRLGTEFIPALDEGSIAVNIMRLPSASLEGSVLTASEIEKRLLKYPEIKTIVSKTGRAEISEDPMGPEQNDIFIMLNDKDQWRPGITKKNLIDDINNELQLIPGIRASITQPIALRVNELISGVKSDLAVKIFGDDLEVLRQKAVDISGILASTEGATDVKVEQVSGFSQINVEIDRESIARHKINVADINEIIETAVGGKVASRLVEGRKRFAILIRFPYEKRNNIQSLSNILIPSPEGYKVPLEHLAKIKEEEGPAQISHENNLRRIVVECNIRGRDTGSFVQEIQDKIKPIEKSLPVGYFIEYGGQFENQERAQNKLMIVVPISILLIFLLLFAAFDSLQIALLIILNIPFAMVGGIFALYLTGQYLSVPSSIGFIALFGVAVLNGVVLVSYIKQLQESGLSVQQAVLQGSLLRLRPVLMTASVATFGLLPLLFSIGVGSEIQRPLATVVVGGLITSTILTLLVLPAIYPWFQKKESK